MGEPRRHFDPTALLPGREAIGASLLADEAELVETLIETARFSETQLVEIDVLATRLVAAAREGRAETEGVDSFLHEYGLSSEEGVLLLCLAEALLRIPDAATADRLIAGTVGSGDWGRHLGQSELVARQRLDLRVDAYGSDRRLGRRAEAGSRKPGAAPDCAER